MARKKAEPRKKLEYQPGRIVDEYHTMRPAKQYWGREYKPGMPDVPGTVKIVEGVTESGTPWRSENFIPDRTPEEQAKWEANVRAAFEEFIAAYIRKYGYEKAREKFEVRG